MSDLNRRQFVMAAACAAGACLMCGGAALAEDTTQPAAGADKVDVGTVADYAKDGVYDKHAMSDKVLIVREKDKIHAMSAKCTHKGATVVMKNGELICPKHGSHFTDEGKPTKGPAKANLFWLPITKNSDGHIIVDTTKQYGENEHDKPDASISVS